MPQGSVNQKGNRKIVTNMSFIVLILFCILTCGCVGKERGNGNVQAWTEQTDQTGHSGDITAPEPLDHEQAPGDVLQPGAPEDTIRQEGTDDVPEPEASDGVTFPESSGEKNDTSVTIMIYMNASTLESGEEPFAAYDIAQMTEADLSGQVTVILETGGTAKWTYEGISAQTTQRHQIRDGKLCLLEDTGIQQDMTDPDTLTQFISYCAQTAPADRYMLIFWGHGRGPEIGYGMDDFQSPEKAMSLDSMASAIEAAIRENGISFDLIGFDVCLMGNLETVYALRNCCDYLAVSEDYEPAYGWQYTEFLNALSADPSIESTELARIIVEGFMEEAERSGDRGIMAVVDTSYAEALMEAWNLLLSVQNDVIRNLGEETEGQPQTMDELIARIWTDEALLTPVPASPDGYISDDDLYSLQDYGLTDLEAICELSASAEAERLSGLLKESIVCVDSFHMARTMCGLAVCP